MYACLFQVTSPAPSRCHALRSVFATIWIVMGHTAPSAGSPLVKTTPASIMEDPKDADAQQLWVIGQKFKDVVNKDSKANANSWKSFLEHLQIASAKRCCS